MDWVMECFHMQGLGFPGIWRLCSEIEPEFHDRVELLWFAFPFLLIKVRRLLK